MELPRLFLVLLPIIWSLEASFHAHASFGFGPVFFLPVSAFFLRQMLADFVTDDLFADIGAGFPVFAGRLGFFGGSVL